MSWKGLQLCTMGFANIWEYYQQMFLPNIIYKLETVSILYIIWDMYLTDSLKQYTMDRRTHPGTTQRQHVIAGAPIPAKWEAFQRSNAYKDKLFHYMSECVHAWETGRKVISSTQMMKRSSPHRMTWVMSSKSDHVPTRRQTSALCSTLRIVHDKDFAKWKSEPWTHMWLSLQ